MASSGKRKTTMAKLTREAKLRDRRFEKDAKKQSRKQAQGEAGGQQPEPADPDAAPATHQPDPSIPDTAPTTHQPGAEP